MRGVVTDVSGAIIPNATVELSNAAATVHQSMATDEKGEYQFPQLVPGTYTITASSAGMGKQEKIVELLVAQPATINFSMVVSDSTTVNVVATASALNTTDATIGNAVDNATVQALPMEGRNVPDLLSLQPGVLYLGHNLTQAAEDSRSGVVSGARSDQGNVTLDGLDNNDQVTGLAFNGVLRSTLDSVDEFRVTTTGSNAESGRTSGAQVNVVTKSGTNKFTGSLYEYNRNTDLSANDWFNKQSQFKENLPNRAGKLIRNTFGVAVGGPILKDKLFFFGNYESQRTAENQQVTNVVPSQALRSGLLQYTTGDASASNVAGSVGPGTYLAQLTPSQFAQLDPNCSASCPWGHGLDPYVLALAQQFPLPNTTGGDSYNTQGFTWSAPNPTTLNTGIVKFDWVINQKNRLFARGNLQDDKQLSPPLFPTSGAPGFFSPLPQLPQDTHSDGTKGFGVGETWMLSNNLINDARFGYTRQSYSDQGPGKQSYVTPTVIGLPFSTARSQIVQVPFYNLIDDVTWTHKTHTFQFGANYRIVKDSIATDAKSYSSASANSGENFDAISNTGQTLDPASPEGKAAGFAPVLSSFGSSYSSLAMGMAGVVASESIAYQYYNNRDGSASLLPVGSLIGRHFKANELEYYFQDQWRATPKLTLTYGIRHTILQTPYEVNGQQVQPTINLHDWAQNRVSQAAKGIVDQPNFTFSPSGKANHAKPFFPMSWKNFSPRIGIAYALSEKTTIRTGFGLFFDHFGEGLVRNFSQLGSYGLGGSESTPAGYFSPDTAPRFTSATTLPSYSPDILPPSLLPNPAQKITYPYSPPASGQAFAWAMDDKLQTPYSYTMNLDIQHELPKGFTVEGAYVGRLGRHLIVQRDLGMPLDLVDPNGGMDYFTAASLLEKQAYAKVPTANVAKIPYWEDLFPDAAGAKGSPNAKIACPATVCKAGNSATQNIYNQYAAQPLNATDDLNLMDTLCSPGCGGQLYRYYNAAFSSLYADSTIGYSSYHAAQLMLHHAMSHGLQTDFSYTFSRAIDIGSDTERTCTSCTSIGTTADASTGVLINSFNPRLNKGVADFDTTHIVTADAVYLLPFGSGQRFLNSGNKIVNGIFGGWQLNGLGRWTSGLPFSLQISGGWMTAWPKQSMTIETRKLGKLAPKKTILKGGIPDAFPDPTTLVAGISGLADTGQSPLRYPLPGEVGERNKYRGDGYFGIDSGLMKTWKITNAQSLRFDWEVFNVTNSVRFDTNPVTSLQNAVGKGNLGAYTHTLSQPRIQQISLRYSF
ncbi:TonB-dependent receptor domain-containing protein [Silvibacterium acidisoli]|uniref:TonB-dependent receptor domain-containing protein n=1 Tax=Acidobacteriaceae bacterium ZG23-2 TaxID=2883246 RepID=UPI00406BF59C